MPNINKHLSYLILFLVVAVTVLPLGVLYGHFFQVDREIWTHLFEYVLPEATGHSLLLAGGVAFLSFLLGVVPAWIVTLYEFPGKKFLTFGLILPLSFPLYILAFVYLALFDQTGAVPMALSTLLGRPVLFPSLRNPWAAMVILSLGLYPYVYLLTRQALDRNLSKALEVGATLGLGRHQCFLKIILPLIRPWIISGMLLVIMETLADFGAVSILNVRTFSVLIYRTWFGLFSLESASQLAAVMVTLVFFLVFFQQQLISKKRYWSLGRTHGHLRTVPLQGWKKWSSSLCLGGLFFLAFLLPLALLIYWSGKSLAVDFDGRYWGFIWNSLHLSLVGAFLIVGVSVLVAFIRKKYPFPWVQVLVKISTLGYAIPGTVLAVGIYLPFSTVMSASLVLLFIGLFIRFFTIGLSGVDTGLEKISRSQMESVRMLGLPLRLSFIKIYWPVLKSAIFTSFLFCFVEIMKEMPITLMMRPFGKETLAIRIFELTSEGEWERAALPALWLVLMGPIPLLWINRIDNRGKKR